MPTAYTHKLEEMNFDVKDWMLRIIPRAMGVCVCLREDGLDLTVEQVREKIAHVTPYYQVKVDELREKIAIYESMTDTEWECLLSDHIVQESNAYLQRVREAQAKKKKYLEAITKINALPQQFDELPAGAIRFALEQIRSTIDFDYAYEPKPQLFADWKTMKQDMTKKAHKDYAHYAQEQAKELDRTQARVEAYDRYVEFIEKAME